MCSAWLTLALAVTACDPGPSESPTSDPASLEQAIGLASALTGLASIDLDRAQLSGDIYHYSLRLQVGSTPNAHIRIHRVVREDAPWHPQSTPHAVMLLHGDFATFSSNFAPSLVSASTPPAHGLAVHLAQHGIDVWGLDRRWTQAPPDAPAFADFADMGFAGAIDDTERALAVARWIRGLTSNRWGRFVLSGFSRGGQLAYLYAAEESTRAPAQRHVEAIAPIDIYHRLPPEDEELRQLACAARDAELAMLADGVYESDNGFFIALGSLAASAPDDPSPFVPGLTNRGAMLWLMAQTYAVFMPTPLYHLVAGVIVDDEVTGFRYSPEDRVADWLAAAPPYQALREIADGDVMWCGEGLMPVASDLSAVHVPLLYLGAAGGFGDRGVYSTTLVGSADVTVHVVRRLPPDSEAEDFGHADLLYADDAPALAWTPLASWILAR